MMGLLFPTFKNNHSMIFRMFVTLGPAVGLILLAVLLPVEISDPINAIAWVLSNVLLAYSAIVVAVFLIAYFLFFDPRATTGGRLIFQFMLSLIGIISLNVIGIFINPSHNNSWYLYPMGVEVWRPAVRLIIYGFVAYAITSLAVLLVLRKWFPEKIKKVSDIKLKVRTSEIPTVEDTQPPVTGNSKTVFRRDKEAPTDLIEESWPTPRSEKK